MATETEDVVPIQKIVTHVKPHIDEILAIWLLRMFGSKYFPGIDRAPVEFWSNGDAKLQIPADEYLKQGVLLVGVGGGIFDEHPTADTERKEGECAATLVAKFLGIDDDPALEKILDFVRRDDLNGSSSPFNIASICLKLYNTMSPEKVILWATLALKAIHHEQIQYIGDAMDEYRKGKVLGVHSKRNSEQVFRVVVIESDNEIAAKIARAACGGNAAVVIQKKSTGNVQILSNQRFRVNMDKIARFVRLAEQKAKGKIITLKPEDLGREGTVPGAEEWFFFRKGRMLFNGSASHPDVPPTNLPLEEITRIVCNCLFH